MAAEIVSEAYQDVLFGQGLLSKDWDGDSNMGYHNQLKRYYRISHKLSYHFILSLKLYCPCFTLKFHGRIRYSHL